MDSPISTPSRDAYSVKEAAERLCMSRSGLYDLIKRRQLTTVKIGKRRLVPQSAIDELLKKNACPAATD